jgi:quinolinate synthase
MDNLQLAEQIEMLKKKQDALILAHNYQPPEIQEIADFVGDSFALSRRAQSCSQSVIVFCGVRFMAESAKILSPQKTVLLPAVDAGCPLADSITVEELKAAKAMHPHAAVVCYINTSAAVKAESDICCTSSNAERVVRSLSNDEILFVPDCHLASYVQEKVPEKKIIPWRGHCIVHSRITVNDVQNMREKNKNALLLVHPEVPDEIRRISDFVGSTGQIIEFVGKSPCREFIIGTETGVLEALRSARPDANFYMLSENLLCVNMKKVTLQKVYDALSRKENEIIVPEKIRIMAYKSLYRMLKV